jgi:phosphoribosylformylglycinamidine synthase
MPVYRFVVRFNRPDPRSAALLADAQALGFGQLKLITCQDLYFIEGQLSLEECRRLALELLTDPVMQTANWDELPGAPSDPHPATVIVEVALRPGVTDPIAAQLVRAAHELGFDGVQRAATGSRFLINGAGEDQASELARRLLANSTIQHWTLGAITPSFPVEAASSGEVETVCLRGLTDSDLLAVSGSRRAALDLAEMKAIQSYFQSEGRDPTDVEFETIAQTWSEHCGHKTFKAKVQVIRQPGSRETLLPGPLLPDYPAEINSILKTYLKSATDQIAAPWVRSAFVDNAGIIDFDDEFEVSFKVETHNHPSAIEPFGGANTGVGGVIRDVLGVSAKPIANTDMLCFGLQSARFSDLPEGVLHPRRVLSGVVAGVQDYGNKMGIPTVNGALWFDLGYTANPLVFCGTVGLAPKGLHVRSPWPGDRVILLGGRTGRDGLRGATFSSMTMDALTGEVSGASVQIGDPITEKGLVDVLLPARDRRLYNSVTDCGAGGLSSAVGEMASTIGAEVDLARVRLKYPGLAPWEIWLSEAQERMVVAVPTENVSTLQDLCDTYNTELTDIGEFTGSGRLVVLYEGKVVLDLANAFLHDGIPQRRLSAVINHGGAESTENLIGLSELRDSVVNFPETLLRLLSHPNIASKAPIIRLYDHEVQGGTVVKPLTGVAADAPSDAVVLKPLGTSGKTGLVLSNGLNPEYGKRDPYRMALVVLDEAVRNAVAVGADPRRIAVLDNFCWGDPLRPETLGSLVEAARGCHDGALLFGTPFISGKDSLNNEYLGADGQRHAIPPTLLVSAIGIIPDTTKAVTMDLKQPGNLLYLVGDFAPVFGGSHFSLLTSHFSLDPVPLLSSRTPAIYVSLHAAIKSGFIRSCHDLSEGGLAVAAAEMCIGGRLGLDLDLGPRDPVRCLFGETTGCLLAEVAPENAAAFERQFASQPISKLGHVTEEPVLSASANQQLLFTLPVSSLVTAWNTPLQ